LSVIAFATSFILDSNDTIKQHHHYHHKNTRMMI